MNMRNRPARVVAAVGAVVAAGTTTFLALSAGTASADEPGRCVENVNVREDPDATSRIVALCEAGTRVKLGAERDGFVRIDEMGGWASKEFVKADESSSGSRSSSSRSSSSDERSSDSDSSGGSSSGSSSRDEGSSDRGSSSGRDGERSRSTDANETPAQAPDGMQELTGLLG